MGEQIQAAERRGREQASAQIIAHADKWAPADGNAAHKRLRRHLLIAASVANPVTDDEMWAKAAEYLTATLGEQSTVERSKAPDLEGSPSDVEGPKIITHG
jgi:hypothetical protein